MGRRTTDKTPMQRTVVDILHHVTGASNINLEWKYPNMIAYCYKIFNFVCEIYFSPHTLPENYIMSFCTKYDKILLQWRHNGRDVVSSHSRLDCLLNCWFRRRSKKTLKCCVTGHCAGNSTVTGELPTQKASNAEMFLFDDVIMLKRINP